MSGYQRNWTKVTKAQTITISQSLCVMFFSEGKKANGCYNSLSLFTKYLGSQSLYITGHKVAAKVLYYGHLAKVLLDDCEILVVKRLK